MRQVDRALSPQYSGEVVAAPAPAVRSVWRQQMWPAVGVALVGAGRELLPEVLAAWRASAPTKSDSALLVGQGLRQGDKSASRSQAGVQARGWQHRRRAMRRGF
jgi:hypothetical protein